LDGDFYGYEISPDEKFVFAYKNRMKQWRHSYFADYYVFDLSSESEIANANIRSAGQHQFVMWSPTGHILLWVTNDKNIFYQSDFSNSDSTVQDRV